MLNAKYKNYEHNPPHLFSPNSTYMITGATYNRIHFFESEKSLEVLSNAIIQYYTKFDWRINAFVVLPNHYHVLCVAPDEIISLPRIVKNIHKITAIAVNKLDGIQGRKICWNYWDSCITFEKSYFARINYIHFNPVKHGYVDDPIEWKYSSYRVYSERHRLEKDRFEKEYPFDRVKVRDDF
jgi:putative transposase